MINRPDTVQQNLRCPLTDQEKIRFGENLARLLEERGEVEDEKTAVVARFKAQLEGIEQAATKAQKVLSAGYEYRWIDCKVLYHKPAVRQKTIVRLDTGEVVREEDMSEDECQENLPLRVSDLTQVVKSDPPAPESPAQGSLLPLQGESREEFECDRNPEPPPAPVVEAPIAAAAAEAVHHGSNGKRKRTTSKEDPQSQGVGVYPA